MSGASDEVDARGTRARSWPRARLLAQLYDWEHDGLQDDIALYRALALRTGGPILELACGSGRVLEGLLGSGLELVGLDRSPEMLERARSRLKAASSRVRLVQGDLHDELPPGPFALVVLALSAFGFVQETARQVDLLRRIRAMLSPGGLVILDLVHAAPLWDEPQGLAVLQRSGHDEAIGADVSKWMVQRILPSAQEIQLDCFYDLAWSDGSLTRLTDSARLRYYARYEIELLLQAASLELETVGGDYQLGPFQDGSERMIVVARSGAG